MDSDLEAFSHIPTDDSFVAMAAPPTIKKMIFEVLHPKI